ncbi:hypothetical protein MRB53_038759 [Persea americana]|nr:hypothetical protein MRB53_038759 [Persea americana]
MSRFVSENDPNAPAAEDDSAWIAAQKVLDAKKLSKQEAGTQEGDAKQEAFEESIRLKNQFRTLDEDEADFLESVLASTRKKEAEERKETVEQLAVFRAQQEAAEKGLAQTEWC